MQSLLCLPEVSSKTDSPLSKLAGANSQKASSEIIQQQIVALEDGVLLQPGCPQLSAEG